jgi:hypothetical protein
MEMKMMSQFEKDLASTHNSKDPLSQNGPVTASQERLNNSPRPRKSLEERFAGYTGDYRGELIDWGEDVSREVIV